RPRPGRRRAAGPPGRSPGRQCATRPARALGVRLPPRRPSAAGRAERRSPGHPLGPARHVLRPCPPRRPHLGRLQNAWRPRSRARPPLSLGPHLPPPRQPLPPPRPPALSRAARPPLPGRPAARATNHPAPAPPPGRGGRAAPASLPDLAPEPRRSPGSELFAGELGTLQHALRGGEHEAAAPARV